MEEDVPPAPQTRGSFASRFINQWHRYRKFLLQYWWIPLLTFSISVTIQYFLGKHSHLSYVSAGKMIMNYKISIPTANVYSEEFNNFFGTQVALMQSDKVKNRVNLRLLQANPDLHPTPVDIAVALTPKTSIFNLQAVGGDPAYTQAYLKATMEEYINLKRELLGNATTATQSSMQEELRELAAQLQESKSNLLNYQSSNSMVLQQGGGNSAADYLFLLQRQLAEQKSDLHMLETLNLDENLDLEQQRGVLRPGGNPKANPPNGREKNNGQNQNAANQPDSKTAAQNSNVTAGNNDDAAPNTPATLGGFEIQYLNARQEILLKKTKRDELSKILKPKHPDMIALNDEIDHLEKLLIIFQDQSKEQLKNREHILKAQIQDKESQIHEYESKAMEVNKKLSDFEAIKENQKRLQTVYDALQANLQTLDMNKGFNQESVTILEPASPAQMIPPDNRKRLVMAALIGLVLGIGILAFINQMDDRPLSISELEQHFDLPLLGQFPLIKSKNKKIPIPILQPDDERYPMVEAYRSLRSALLFKDSAENRPKSIVITSASPNDGKSMISANFAITLAQSGARVLLIDADLRRGVVHQHFSVAQSPGLAEVLGEKWEWQKAVVKTRFEKLSVLPCGAASRNPGHLFAKAGDFISAISPHYDYCIFDTAPVMVADDVLSLAPNAEGLIMVIRAGFTSTRVAQAALDLLLQRKVNVIGLVFNAVHPKSGDYYYYRYKEYYSQHPAA